MSTEDVALQQATFEITQTHQSLVHARHLVDELHQSVRSATRYLDDTELDVYGRLLRYVEHNRHDLSRQLVEPVPPGSMTPGRPSRGPASSRGRRDRAHRPARPVGRLLTRRPRSCRR